MACRKFVVALGMIAAASPVAASQPDPNVEAGAPAASPEARYCLRIEPITGTRIESIRCETREGWAQLEIDVDKEWAKEGVRVIS
jgi:putative hemolysin